MKVRVKINVIGPLGTVSKSLENWEWKQQIKGSIEAIPTKALLWLAEKTLWELRKLAVTQIPVKNYQEMML